MFCAAFNVRARRLCSPVRLEDRNFGSDLPAKFYLVHPDSYHCREMAHFLQAKVMRISHSTKYAGPSQRLEPALKLFGPLLRAHRTENRTYLGGEHCSIDQTLPATPELYVSFSSLTQQSNQIPSFLPGCVVCDDRSKARSPAQSGASLSVQVAVLDSCFPTDSPAREAERGRRSPLGYFPMDDASKPKVVI